MSKYVKPSIECINYRIEERLASACTGSCETSGYKWQKDPVTGQWKEVYLTVLSYSN